MSLPKDKKDEPKKDEIPDAPGETDPGMPWVDNDPRPVQKDR